MDFSTAEHNYRWYTGQLRIGAMTPEQYRLAVDDLRVTDSQGRLWMIQEGSGQWHVLNNGQWQPAAPETPGAPPIQPAPAGRKKTTLWLLPAGILVGLCCLGAAAVGAYQLLNPSGGIAAIENIGGLDEIIPGEPAGSVPVEFEPVETVRLNAGDNQPFGAQGETLTIPAAALPAGVQVDLIASQPDAELARLLQDAFQAEPTFYQLAAAGENDGTGSAVVSVPAQHSVALLMEIIDERYFAFTEIPKQNGEFQVNLPIGSAGKDAADESVSLKGSARFALLQFDPPAAGAVHAGALRSAPDPRSCGIDIQVASYSYMSPPTHKTVSFCRKNLTGTVQVMVYPGDTPNVTSQMADQVADKVEAIMAVYQSKGFTAAKLEDAWQKRVKVVIEAGSGDPYYSSVNGVVHIPQDSLSSSYGKNLDYEIAHELAHWVQDEAYNFTSSYWANLTGVSSESKWWFEVAAENMAFLYNPNFIELNLTTYGMTTPATSNTPFQYAPNQWNDQLYLHAQLVKVFMCGSGGVCPVSEESFAAAINTGAFPYDASALAQVGTKMENYAVYLLGKPPISANTTIPISTALSNGTGYGEFVEAISSEGKPDYKKTGYPPQMEPVSADAGLRVKIAANLQINSAYPLVVSASNKAGLEGFPVELVIEPGPAFYYTLDNGAEKFHDGKTKLTIGPIHAALGYKKVRLAAFTRESAAVFNAVVQPLDLTGDWLIYSTGLTANNYVCQQKEDVEITIHYDELAQFSAIYPSFLSSIAGVFKPEAGSQSYTWAVSPGADLTFGGDVPLSFSGDLKFNGQGIDIKNSMTIPRPEAAIDPVGALASGLPLAGLLLAAVFHRKARPILTVAIIACLVLLTGCVGFSFWGTLSTESSLNKLEEINGRSLQTVIEGAIGPSEEGEEDLGASPEYSSLQPKYVFRGTSTATINMAILDDPEATEPECSGTLTYNILAILVEDGQITSLPE